MLIASSSLFARSVLSWTKSTTSGTCLSLLMLTMVSQRLPTRWSAKLELLLLKKLEKQGLQTPGKTNKSAVSPLSQRECCFFALISLCVYPVFAIL